MAVGDVNENGWLRSTKVLEGATATNGAPSSSSDGVEINALLENSRPETAGVFVVSTAGSGTMTVTLKGWGYNPEADDWAPMGTSKTAANKGKLNEGNAIGETGTNKIQHAEPIDLPRHFTRFYAEIVSIGGTSTAIDLWLTIDTGGV